MKRFSCLKPKWWGLSLVIGILLTGNKLVFAYPSVYPTGMTIYDAQNSYNGYTLYQNRVLNNAVLLDMSGKIVHTWQVPDFKIWQVEPLSGGKLLASGRFTSETYRSVIELDWNSNVVWKYTDSVNSSPHHDLQRLDNGNTLILYHRLITVPEISPGQILDDYIIEVTPQNQVVWTWYTSEHFKEFGFSLEAKALIAKADINSLALGDWAHTNSIQSLPENPLGDTRFKKGNILVSQRNTNIIYVIDRNTKKIVWRLGPNDNISIGQHMVKMINPGLSGAGNIIMFDNGGKGGYAPTKCRLYSRIVEINPLTKRIVWEYNAGKSGKMQFSFFSGYWSGAQRLPNGNTLIDEGWTGRFFEVTAEGKIVWEYINPNFDNKLTLQRHIICSN